MRLGLHTTLQPLAETVESSVHVDTPPHAGLWTFTLSSPTPPLTGRQCTEKPVNMQLLTALYASSLCSPPPPHPHPDPSLCSHVDTYSMLCVSMHWSNTVPPPPTSAPSAEHHIRDNPSIKSQARWTFYPVSMSGSLVPRYPHFTLQGRPGNKARYDSSLISICSLSAYCV